MRTPLVDRYVEVEGHRVRYVETGSGPPLLLVHGLGNSIQTWRKNLDVLGHKFRVIALDLPGHGLSDPPRSRFDLPASTRFLSQFMDCVGIESAHIAGNSMGGIVALELALRQPRRVRSLTLVDSAGLGREIARFLRLGSVPGIGELFDRPSYKRAVKINRWLVYDPACIEDEAVRLWHEYKKRPGATAATLRFLRVGVTLFGQRRRIRRLERLNEIDVPVMVLWGREDPLVPVSHALAAKEAAPKLRLHVFEQCGHWPQVEHPREFNETLTAFIQEVESARAASDPPPNPTLYSVSGAATPPSAEESRAELFVRQHYIRWFIVGLVLAIIITAFIERSRLTDLEHIVHTLGYPAVFILALAGAGAMVLPLPSTAAIFLGGAALTPVYVGLIAGVAEAMGEITGYAVGYSGQGIAKKSKVYGRLEHIARKNGGLAVLIFSVVPNPIFDVVGITAGVMRYPLWRFLMYAWIGKTIKNIGIAYAGALGAEWVLHLFGGSA